MGRWRNCVLPMVVLCTSEVASAASYSFINIADTNGPYNGFDVAPTINNSGTVAFYAGLDGGGQGIYTGNGGAVTTIADTTAGGFTQFSNPSINAGGTVGFWGSQGVDGSGIFTGSGGLITTIAHTTGIYSNFGSLTPAISDGGTVAFWAGLDIGRTGIYTSSGTAIAESNGPYLVLSKPRINAGGTVAFWSLLDGGSTSGIYTGSGGPVTTIADTDGPYSGFGEPTINDGGTVAFRANLDGGGSGIFTSSGGSDTTITTTAGAFSGFREPRINAGSDVVFGAFLDGGGTGIFTGPDSVADKVIRDGDPLFGSTVTVYAGMNFYGELNDSGDIAFVYKLSNGIEGIAVAHRLVLGDTDGDGDVDFDDFLAVQNFFGDPGPDSPGDADNDGDCDFDDFLAVNNYYGVTPPGAAFVPEPASLSLLALGATVILILRRALK